MASTGVPRRERLDALTSIRFIFAAMVVATHFSGLHPGGFPGWVGPLGGTAVSWFFILSGFILAYNFPSLPDARSRLEFIVSRFWRLFPVQAVRIFASLMLFPSGWGIVHNMSIYFYQSVTLTHSWTAIPFSSQVFNVPAWSISDEWFFYILFPLLIALSWPYRLAVAGVAAGIALLWATVHGCWSGQQAFQFPGDSLHVTCNMLVIYWLPIRLWEFVLGIGVCELVCAVQRRPMSWQLQALALSAAAFLFFDQDSIIARAFPGFYASFFASWVISALVGALIICALAVRTRLSGPMSSAALVFLGEISFSVYMTHMLVLRYLDEGKIGYDLPCIAQFCTVLIVVSAISAVVFLLIERPSRHLLKLGLRALPRNERRLQAV